MESIKVEYQKLRRVYLDLLIMEELIKQINAGRIEELKQELELLKKDGKKTLETEAILNMLQKAKDGTNPGTLEELQSQIQRIKAQMDAKKENRLVGGGIKR